MAAPVYILWDREDLAGIVNVQAFTSASSVRMVREKGRDLTQSYDKGLHIHRKIPKHKNATKTFYYTSIAYLERSVGATTDTQLVWLNRFTSAQPSY